MKSKILCLIIITAIVCSIFVISASAEVYNGDAYVRSSPLSTSAPIDFISNGQTITLNSNYTYNTPLGDVTFTSFRIYREDVELSNNIDFNVSAYISEYSTWTNVFGVAYSSDGEFLSYSTESANVSLTGYIDIPSYDVALWLYQFVEFPFNSTGVLSAGSYQISGDFLDISAFSWINSGDTVYFNANGYIIQDFNSGSRFTQIALSYYEISANEYFLTLSALVNGSLKPFVTFTFSPMGNIAVWNNENFAGSHGIYFDNDVVLPTDLLNIFLVFFDEFEQVYTGNVWYDIIDNVVEALQVDVFGYFSPWDILTTFIGLAIFLWLLKALAGG